MPSSCRGILRPSTAVAQAAPHGEPQEPFLSRDVFQLIVRLEEQRVARVDVDALERQFSVPAQYGEPVQATPQLHRDVLSTPGPGAYSQRDDDWLRNAAHSSAIFASTTSRSAPPKARRGTGRRRRSDASMPAMRIEPKDHIALGTFARAARLLDMDPDGAPSSPLSTQRAMSASSSTPSLPEATASCKFSRAPREPPMQAKQAELPGPGAYQTSRFGDRPISCVPTAAVFGADREQREMLWSPARGLPSGALHEAWNESAQYARYKHLVEARRKQQARDSPPRRHPSRIKSAAASSSSLSSIAGHPDPSTSVADQGGPDSRGAAAMFDPFAWLRSRPDGDEHVRLLALQHGIETLPDGSRTDAVSSLQVSAVSPDSKTAADASNDGKISLSCRVPGGTTTVAVRTYKGRSLRQLKSWILHHVLAIQQQQRHPRPHQAPMFTSIDQFELYLPNGTRLTELTATLEQCGLRDRALVQVVPSNNIQATEAQRTGPDRTIASPSP